MEVMQTSKTERIKAVNSCKRSVSLSPMSIPAFPPAKPTLFVIPVPVIHCWSEQGAWKANLA